MSVNDCYYIELPETLEQREAFIVVLGKIHPELLWCESAPLTGGPSSLQTRISDFDSSYTTVKILPGKETLLMSGPPSGGSVVHSWKQYVAEATSHNND